MILLWCSLRMQKYRRLQALESERRERANAEYNKVIPTEVAKTSPKTLTSGTHSLIQDDCVHRSLALLVPCRRGQTKDFRRALLIRNNRGCCRPLLHVVDLGDIGRGSGAAAAAAGPVRLLQAGATFQRTDKKWQRTKLMPGRGLQC